MANQFLKVKYDRKRKVYIDGVHSGFTNKKLRVEEGLHDVDLGEPYNYDPECWAVDVFDTSVGRPLVVTFVRLDDLDGEPQDADDRADDDPEVPDDA